VLLAGLGLTLVIATGGIDLSVGAVLAMAGSTAAWVLTETEAGAAGAVAAGLAVGLGAGAWNGGLVALLRIQPIVATLMLMVAGRGIAQLITAGQIVTFSDAGLAAIGSGHALGFPTPVAIAAGVYALVAVLCRTTALRLFVEATGSNALASRVAGVAVGTVKLAAYAFAGVCSAVAGLVTTADIRAADANNAGLYLELDAILAVVIGGTALTGGRFSIWGTVIGALVIQTLTTTILTHGVPVEYTLAVKGMVVLGICMLQSERVRAAMLRRGVRT
jgi:simple sugar transport system permease protein